MKFSEADTSGGLLIKGYEQGRIRVGSTDYRASLIVAPDRVIDDWPPQTVDELRAEHFTPILALNPQVIVLGTGETHRFPDPACYVAAMEKGIGVEIMETGAACRTYNILMAEGRSVAAALIMI